VTAWAGLTVYAFFSFYANYFDFIHAFVKNIVVIVLGNYICVNNDFPVGSRLKYDIFLHILLF
jgi:hypothetical protein